MEANSIKPLDLLLLSLAKQSNEKKEKDVRETIQKIIPLIKESGKPQEAFKYLVKIYEKIKDDSMAYFLLVLEYFSIEFDEINSAVDYRIFRYISSFIAVLSNHEGIKSILPLKKFFKAEVLESKNINDAISEEEYIQRAQEYWSNIAFRIDESNFFIIMKCFPVIVAEPVYEFEICYQFLKNSLAKKLKKLLAATNAPASKNDAEFLLESRNQFA